MAAASIYGHEPEWSAYGPIGAEYQIVMQGPGNRSLAMQWVHG
jgi:hypothetical protein